MASYVTYLFIWSVVIFSLGEAQDDSVDTKHRICYGELGCFSNEEPFAKSMPLPMSPKKINTRFFLHTRYLNGTQRLIKADKSSIKSLPYNPSNKTKVIVHGFVVMKPKMANWVPDITRAILAKEDVNVITVNWVGGARVAYDHAVSNTRIVGAQVADLIKLLMKIHHVEASSFHLIGFSLGAHVAGFAGKDLKKTNPKFSLGRISGLDPASPGFNSDSSKVRLDKEDAKFVDVIHTDTSTLLVVASGLNRNIGHVDFYPNGGASQPGCNTWKKDYSWVTAVTDSTVCDHARAPELFTSTVNSTKECDFAAYRCKSYEKFKSGLCVRCNGRKSNKSRCAQMGYWAEPPATNKQIQYYLDTSDSAPFCAKHYQVRMHWRKVKTGSIDGFRGKLFVTLHGDMGSTNEYALNDGVTTAIIPGETSRFLVVQDCKKDIGNVDRVSFRWERPTCWTYFFCPQNNVFLKRIKVIDSSQQKRLTFQPLELDRDNDGRKDLVEVKDGEVVELFRKSYIRKNFSGRLNRNSINHQSLVVPQLVDVDNTTPKAVLQGNMQHKNFQERNDSLSSHSPAP